MNMFSIETPRLIIRDLLESDLKPFFQLGSDPAIKRFQHYIRVENENEARSWLQNAVFHNPTGICDWVILCCI